jgi:hypothetical protein
MMTLRDWIMLFRMLRAEARARQADATPGWSPTRPVQWRHGGSRADGANGQGWRHPDASQTPHASSP